MATAHKNKPSKTAQGSRTKRPKPVRRAIKKSNSVIQVPATFALAGLAGLVLVLLGSFYLLYAKTVLSFAVAPVVVANAHLRGATPTRITIDSLNLSLDTIPTTIADGIWQVPDGSAAYLESSARPKEGGNIIVYGHNKRELFGPLRSVQLGDTIRLEADDGTTHTYTVAEIKTVNPNAVNEVLPTKHEVLTVYTCTGIFDSQRLVIKAYPS